MELRPKLSWDQLVHRHIICLFPHFLMFNWNKYVYVTGIQMGRIEAPEGWICRID